MRGSHGSIAAKPQASVYFAHPYNSWERCLNENGNGLIRQHFPRGMNLTDIADEHVQLAVKRLNHRPRKVLEGRSSHEVLFWVEMRCTKPPLAVALRT